MRYRTKPCEIEAIEWTGKNVLEIETFTNGTALWGDNLVKYYPSTEQYRSTILEIPTLEGNLRASIGDFIIKGLRGEFYPCKPDVFHQKYEVVTDD